MIAENPKHNHLFLAPTDDEQSDLSAMSSATPSAASFLMGNRFFGPDFNIDQLRCKFYVHGF